MSFTDNYNINVEKIFCYYTDLSLTDSITYESRPSL